MDTPLFTDAPAWGDDPELDAVTTELLRLDPSGDRFASVIRETLDQLLDGRRTGRWSYVDLHKTEKTHMGTLVEINLHKAFAFDDGDVTDYRVAGIEVDCKFSQTIGGWEFGPEMVGHLALVVWARDQESTWRAGLVRASHERLRATENRDAKRKLTLAGVNEVRWLWPEHQRLDPNLYLHLAPEKRERIMSARGSRGRHAKARIFQMCREIQGVILRRAVVETAGWGLDDPLKRMRSAGGARDELRGEGLLVLGHQDNDPMVARSLGLPVPQKGEFVVTRVSPSTDGQGAEIAGTFWRVASELDPVVAAPVVPRRSGASADKDIRELDD